jgi:hypothetical protein
VLRRIVDLWHPSATQGFDMQFKLLETEAEAYRCFIDTRTDSAIYHTLEWREIIRDTYGYQPHYLIALDNHSIQGVLPLFQVNSFINGRHLTSIPFSHCVNILYADETVLEGMVESAKDLAARKKCDYIEVRHGMGLPEISGIKCCPHFFSSILPIPNSLEAVWNGFESSVKRAIRKAEKSPLKIIQATSLNHYHQFFMLEVETRKRQGAPPYAFRFFRNLYLKLHASDKARLYMAYAEGLPVGGILMLYHHKTAIYGYGGSVSNKDLLKFRPNNLLFWQAIKDAHQRGCEIFDFGTTPPSNKGLLRFKSGWGTRTAAIPYYFILNRVAKIPIVDRQSRMARLAAGIFRTMPKSLLRALGPYFLKQLG